IPGRNESAGAGALAEIAVHWLRRSSQQRSNLGASWPAHGNNLHTAELRYGSGDAGGSFARRHDSRGAFLDDAGVDSVARPVGLIPDRENPHPFSRTQLTSVLLRHFFLGEPSCSSCLTLFLPANACYSSS